MKKLALFVTFLLLITYTHAQDFSNKGKEFWISYAGHIDATSSVMGVYITSNVNASGNVTVGTTVVPYTVTANNVTRIFIGSSGVVDASNASVYLSTMDGIQTSSAIHVTANKPVAVYAHIIKAARSGATLVIPVNVWGKEYIAPSYRNTGGTASYGEINVMAADTNTLVEITPSVNSRNGLHAAGVPFTITLVHPGDVYQLQFQGSADISGTKVRSISSGLSGCKPIGVFSATTWSGFDCSTANSGDNLYQQLFPISAWGKNFLTAPFYSRNSDIVRVFVQDPTTVIDKTESGITTTLSGTPTNGYYEYHTSQPTKITADKPISVVQYITSQNCGGLGPPPGDPEMVVLNPLEQTINDITVFSAHQNYVPANQSNVNSCYLNIIIKTSAAPSFKINGSPPSSSFIPIPGTTYSYLQENVTSITLINPVQTLKADSSFSAIAYGFGNVESYGYNAGTNVKDLFQHVIIKNQYASVDFPATCVATPFNFAITLPYLATALSWDFHGNFTNVTNNAPVPDSSYLVDGKTVYVYKLPNQYTYNAIGTYQVSVTAINPTSDGCSGTNQIDYDVEVYDKPNANFYWTHTGCLSDSVHFYDTTNGLGRPVVKWKWQFGDATIDSVKNPVKLYGASGTYNVKMSVITDVGCLADTTEIITINPAPIAKFGASILKCAGVPVTFTDSSTITTGTIVKWFWNYGNGQPVDTVSTNAPRTVTYAASGTYTVTLTVQASGGCKSLVFGKTIVINATPVANFQIPVICLPAGTGQFTSTSTISDGTQNQFMYNWDFGDGGTATTANPIHQYTTAGPFNIKLTVKSNNGCLDDTIRALTTLYPQPAAQFNAPSEICLGDTAQFTDQSTATNSTITKWYWSFGDGSTDTTQNPRHTYLAAGTYTVKFVSHSAIGCISDTLSKQITINALPTANFTIGAVACANQPVTFTNTSVANSGTLTRWQWDFGDGTPVLDVANGNPVTHTYSNIQSYNVTFKVTSDKGCKSTAVTKMVVIGSVPTVNFGLPQVCLNDPYAEFTDSSTISDGTGSAFQYLWNFGDPNSTPANNTSIVKNARHTYTSAAVYNVSLTVTSSRGCSATLTKPVTINGSTPISDFAIQNNGNICSSDTVNIQNQSRVNFGAITKLEVYWDYTNNPGLVFTDNAPMPNKIYKNKYANSTQVSTQHTIRVLAYSGGICFNEISKTITVFSNPVAGISINPVQVCLGDVINFNDSSNNANLNITNWIWNFGDNTNGNTKILPHTFGQAGTYTVSLQNKTMDGCLSPVVTKPVTVNPIPMVNAGPDLFVLQGGQAVIKATTNSTNLTGFLWSPATWLSDSAILQPVTKPLTDITYTLTVTGTGNCTASDDVTVKVLKDLEIPNAFSPNGDGINDLWVIKSLESYPGTVIQIFDRYGRLVLTSSGYAIPWDGKVNGTPLPIGTYYYIIDPKNGRKAITGSVTILR